LLEQGAEETVVLQGSHVGIRKKSAGMVSKDSGKQQATSGKLKAGLLCSLPLET
jgi:hypothetical protein